MITPIAANLLDALQADSDLDISFDGLASGDNNDSDSATADV